MPYDWTQDKKLLLALTGLFVLGIVLGAVGMYAFSDYVASQKIIVFDERSAVILDKEICPNAPLDLFGKWVFVNCDIRAFFDEVKLLAETQSYEELLEQSQEKEQDV